ncbi:MAG: MoaD/ThiS family protein [Candidatus Bathyarchaeota archaeon]|nr:MAG: MoaD/ThiS family protein [Candidatus Bathyarchaeota archaeon]
MKVKVRYLGPIRVMLNKKEEGLDVPQKTTLLGLLERLAKVYGESFVKEVYEPKGKIREGIVVTINGTAVGQLGGLKRQLNEGDAITILPFFAGGG